MPHTLLHEDMQHGSEDIVEKDEDGLLGSSRWAWLRLVNLSDSRNRPMRHDNDIVGPVDIVFWVMCTVPPAELEIKRHVHTITRRARFRNNQVASVGLPFHVFIMRYRNQMSTSAHQIFMEKVPSQEGEALQRGDWKGTPVPVCSPRPSRSHNHLERYKGQVLTKSRDDINPSAVAWRLW
jgi:hypothetical protein